MGHLIDGQYKKYKKTLSSSFLHLYNENKNMLEINSSFGYWL